MIDWTGKAVIVRASAAGCHFGYVESISGNTITLNKSRRLWRFWSKENGSLSGVAAHGLDQSKSSVGDPVRITIFDPCEIIECTKAGILSIEGAKWTAR